MLSFFQASTECLPLQLHNKVFKFNSIKNKCGEGIKEFFFKYFFIQKITDMLSSNHDLSLYTKLHRMDKRKSFAFARQYRNCFSRRVNDLVPRNQPIKTAVSIVMHDFQGLKTMTFHRVADIAYF